MSSFINTTVSSFLDSNLVRSNSNRFTDYIPRLVRGELFQVKDEDFRIGLFILLVLFKGKYRVFHKNSFCWLCIHIDSFLKTI